MGMKKRWIGLLTGLLLTVLMMTAAFAGGYEDDIGNLYTMAQANVNGVLYMAAYRDDGAALVRMDSEALNFYSELSDGRAFRSSTYLDGNDEGKGEAQTPADNAAFLIGGDRLLALDPYAGKVFEITVEDRRLVYTDVVTGVDCSFLMEYIGDDYSYCYTVTAAYAINGRAYLSFCNWTNETDLYQLWSIDLKTGDAARVQTVSMEFSCALPDGTIAAVYWPDNVRYDEEKQESVFGTVCVIDPATGTVIRELGRLPGGIETQPQWLSALNMIVYQNGSRVMGMDLNGTVKQIAYAPIPWANTLQCIGDQIFISNGETHCFLTPRADFNAENCLNVYGSYMNEGATLFASRYPDVQVYYSDKYFETTEQFNQAMISGEDRIDILCMSVEYSAFTTLMQKGYCLDLSSCSEITEQMAAIYPDFTQAVTQDGKLMAIPMYAYGGGWFYSPEALNTVGLTEEDLPHTMIELCEFVTRWNDEIQEEYPETPLFYGTNVRESVLESILSMWFTVCESRGEELRFDDPELRAVLEAWEAMETDNIEDCYVENEYGEWHEPLLLSGETTIGSSSWMSGGDDWHGFLNMTFNEETPVLFSCDLMVMFINPRSANIENAQHYLACQLEKLENDQKLVLRSDMTEPVEWDYYADWIDNIKQYIAELEVELKNAENEEERSMTREMIDEYNRIIGEEGESMRWAISPAAIEYYRQNVIPNLVVMQPSIFTQGGDSNTEMASLLSRYQQKQITMDQYLREADNKLRMMRLENR